MITNYKLQNLDFCKDINDLLCQIDVKLASEGRKKLDSLKYGEKSCIDIELSHILSTYRKILVKKVFNKCYLTEYLIDDLINIIRQYLNSGKAINFKRFK